MGMLFAPFPEELNSPNLRPEVSRGMVYYSQIFFLLVGRTHLVDDPGWEVTVEGVVDGSTNPESLKPPLQGLAYF
jgi:hypothetical protein